MAPGYDLNIAEHTKPSIDEHVEPSPSPPFEPRECCGVHLTIAMPIVRLFPVLSLILNLIVRFLPSDPNLLAMTLEKRMKTLPLPLFATNLQFPPSLNYPIPFATKTENQTARIG